MIDGEFAEAECTVGGFAGRWRQRFLDGDGTLLLFMDQTSSEMLPILYNKDGIRTAVSDTGLVFKTK